MTDYAFNHDGGVIQALAHGDLTEQAAADMLVRPLADAGFNVIDWCLGTTGEHNCRTRHNKGVAPFNDMFKTIGRIVEHYNAQDLDLLDIVIKHGRAAGMKVFGNMRLNHCVDPQRLADCPGPVNFCHYASIKKDFRQQAFHVYLAEVFEDILAKGVDGISLDFERKAPFFPPGTPREEKFDATWHFMQRIRALTDKPIAVRVAYEPDKGEAQGQQPLRWIEAGLVDVVIPATHNHEPDPLDWSFAAFRAAAARAPRPCAVWPQVWPTGGAWCDGESAGWPPQRIIERSRQLVDDGADGVYYFNFCCYDETRRLLPPPFDDMFRRITTHAASERTHS